MLGRHVGVRAARRNPERREKPELDSGTKLGPYQITAPLGAGGMGEVYRATQSNLGRTVALKILSPDLAANADRLRRFEQEARAASALNHPNIVSIYDIGREGATAFIAMEFVDGKTLRALVESGPLPIKRALHLAVQIADGLAKAHAAGIVHRDLKPENVMVTRDGLVKILDFGLAKLIPVASDSSETLTAAEPGTNPGVVLGTVGYMSPEQARGAAVDFRSDVFAFGSVLYEMLTGKRPFQGQSSAQTMAAIIEHDPKPISELNPKVPAPLRWIVERCLAKDPEERYASTRDLARDLASIRDHLSESASAVAGIEQPARRASSLQFWSKFAAWTAFVALACLALGWFLPHPVPVQPQFHTLTFSGLDTDPTVSPDGRTLAFVSNRDGVPRIWLKQIDNGSETPLSPGPDLFPRYSPDGSWLLFVRNGTLYRMPAFGGDPRKLLDNVEGADWSPDGAKVAFVRTEVEGSQSSAILGVFTIADSSTRLIHRFQNQPVTVPAWSPDGSTIALVPEPVGNVGTSERYVILIGADGSNLRQLKSPLHGGMLSGASWANSGQDLIYFVPDSAASAGGATVLTISPVVSQGHVILQNVRTSKSRVLFALPAPTFQVAPAGSGRLILDSLAQRNNLKEVSLSAKPGLSAERWLTRGYSVDRQPYYAPDGKSVIFATTRTGDVDLWEVSTGSDSLRRLTDHPAVDWDPFVTPDGKHLIFSSSRSGNFEIWMADRDGSAPIQVSHDGFDAENPVATADGWVLYSSANPKYTGLWKVREDGSQASLLVPGIISWPDVSPDGKYVLLHIPTTTSGRLRIAVVRISDGAPMSFTAEGLRARFTPDGKSIVYVRALRAVQDSEIVSQPFPSSSGAPVKVLVPASPDGVIETFALAPDGKHMAISYAQLERSLLMVDGVEGISAPKAK